MNRTVRLLVVLSTYATILVAGHWVGIWLASTVGGDLSTEAGTQARQWALAGLAVYAVMMALPFMPGIEISLALLAAFGSQIALYIYAATVIALTASFLVGRLVPLSVIAHAMHSVSMQRAEQLLRRLGPLNRRQRLEMLVAQSPKQFIPILLRHRYLAIAIALNTPGNALIGGGGGIALLAGASGLFSFWGFLLVLAVAVLPVPLLVMIVGM